ncbi:UDP binding domain-containing protein [Dactylosporangium matsuzakiense]|uniref:UDP binding domain-containing protein n=1 Tax=Dactylosporangium matsuzakiense TaxID=53360 RepID=UPI0034D958A9
MKAGIDDVRDSPALDVAEQLQRAGAQVTVYSPQASPRHTAPHPTWPTPRQPSPPTEAHLIIVATGWPEFAAIDSDALTATAATPAILDARGVIGGAHWTAAGWTVHGRGSRP